MTDTHTHILPKMDDGAASTDISIEMLREERRQGVDTVVLTPHFYPEDESIPDFLRRREASFRRLRERIDALEDAAELPELMLGAEVAWGPGLSDMDGLQELCYEGSRHILIELPFSRWSELVFIGLDDLVCRLGLTPVIAHVDRYLRIEDRGRLQRLFDMGLPMQIGSVEPEGLFRRSAAMELIRSGAAQLLISDCHNMKERKPSLESLYAAVRKKCGPELCSGLEKAGDRLASRRGTV